MHDITFADSTPPGRMRRNARQAKRSGKNTSTAERILSFAGAAALGKFATRKKGVSRVLAGLAAAALAERALTGRCRVYRRLGIDRSRDRGNGLVKQHGPAAVLEASEAIRLEATITVDRPIPELFRYWRQLDNLPNVMHHIESVEVISPTRSRWTLSAPAGQSFTWDADIINEIENELIAWKSTPDASVPNAGSVHFEPVDGGTEIRVLLEYDPNSGNLQGMAARLLPAEADRQLREDLENFKAGIESGAAELFSVRHI